MKSSFVIIILLSAAVLAQDVIDIAVRGISDANKDGAQQDRLEAIMDAKRQACEKAGLRIQSITTVENFQTTYDLVESQSEAVLLPGFQIIDNGYAADGTYSVVLVGKVKVVANMTGVKEIVAASEAARNQALEVTGEEKQFYWAALLEKDKRKNLLQKSLLLAIEAYKREPGKETETAVLRTLALLPLPVAKAECMDGVNDIAFSKKGNLIAAVSDDACAVVWQFPQMTEYLRFEHQNELTKVRFSPDDASLTLAGRDSLVVVWQMGNRNKLAQMKHAGPVTVLDYSPDSRLLASASAKDSAVFVWDPASGDIITKIRHNSESVRQALFTPDGKHLATIAGHLNYSNSENYTACIWRISDGECITKVAHERTQSKSMTGIEAIAISPDGRLLATASDDNSVGLWQIETGKLVHKLRHRSAVIDVAFGQQGKRLVSASRDQTARVWDVASGKEVLKVVHEDILRTARLSPDENYLLSGSLDRTARLFEISSGREIYRTVHGDAVNMVKFSPDGTYFVTGPQSWDRNLKVWKIVPENMVREACRCAGRNLTPEEWKSVFQDEAYTKTCPDL